MEHYKCFIGKIGSFLDAEFIKIVNEQFETLPFNFFQMLSDDFKLGVKMTIEVLYSEDRKEPEE